MNLPPSLDLNEIQNYCDNLFLKYENEKYNRLCMSEAQGFAETVTKLLEMSPVSQTSEQLIYWGLKHWEVSD